VPTPATLFLVATAALILAVTPGPAVLYIAARSVHQGRAAGLVSAAGIQTGTLFHIAAAAFGLSAILMKSALAFEAIRYAGAAYLIWMGIKALRANDDVTVDSVASEPLGRIFRTGVAVNLLNPKTALFFFAFLPQFVDPTRGAAWLQILILGVVFMTIASASDAMYAVLAGTAGGWLRSRMKLTRRVSGTVYLALGITAAIAPARK
jgi:threonine/homoserine/homoserine lactone efflux protein